MNLQGLNKQQVEESRQKHGANTLTQIPPEPLWKKILEGFKDPMIMILLGAGHPSGAVLHGRGALV